MTGDHRDATMRTIAAIAALTLAACSSGTEPFDPDLRLEIQLGSAAVDYTDSVRVSLTLTNVSQRTIEVLPADAYGICMRAFEVFDSRKRHVSVTEAFCALSNVIVPEPIDLAPGSSIAITDWWNPGESTVDGEAITPGVYQLRGRAIADERVARSGLRAILVR
jgi:hypothetical protein